MIGYSLTLVQGICLRNVLAVILFPIQCALDNFAMLKAANVPPVNVRFPCLKMRWHVVLHTGWVVHSATTLCHLYMKACMQAPDNLLKAAAKALAVHVSAKPSNHQRCQTSCSLRSLVHIGIQSEVAVIKCMAYSILRCS